MKVARKLWTWALALVATFALVLGLSTVAYAAAGEVPAHEKSATDNGDGTYTLELSVTGDADDETQEAGKVNILVIYDTSSSMTSNAQGSNYTRADQAEDVVHDFLTNLAKYQNNAKDNINVALVTFARYTDQHNEGQTWTTDVTALANRFDDGGTDRQTNMSYSGNQSNGTNWESALIKADNLLASAPGGTSVPTFVIMMTDGAPTASGNGNNAINPSGATIAQLRNFYGAATEYAYAVAQACKATGGTFYGIYAYGTEADLVDDLMYYSVYNQHRGGNINNVVAATQDAPNFFRAADTAALDAAITEIFNEVVNALGISSVSISDGTTNQVATSTGVSELLEIDESSYQYWLSIPVVNNQFTRKMNVIEGGVSRVEEVTYTVTDNGDGTCTVNWTEAGSPKSVTVDGSVSSGNFKYEWTESNDLYKYNPPAAKLTNGSVDWNLSSVGTLLDGVTYSVTFKVYPSQETLDDVADIKNNPGENGAWKDLDPAVQQYIDVNGNLKTNTTATLTYSDTRLTDPGPKTTTFTNPDPVKNSAIEELAVTKDWSNLLEDDWKKPDSVTLNVTRDDDPHYSVTLNDDNSWTDTVFISIGIMGADGKPLDGSEGHDFTFTEPEIQGESFKWEIDAPTVHPMLIKNVVTMLVKADADHPVPDGATTYEFNDATYYVDEAATALTATNERRSSLNITKVVDGDDAPEDAIFPFTLHVNDPLAPATAPSEEDDPGHDSDYWIWISVRDKDGNRITEGVEGATHDGGGWWYAPNDTDVTIPVKAGYSIRINNVPVGTTYTITEGELPEGFIFESSALSFVDGDEDAEWAFEGGQTSSGSIDTTNAVFLVTFTNKYELVDVNVDKVWDDNSNQDGIRPETLELTLNGAPTGTTVPTPEITKSEDGNTWTYVWKGLPRFDSAGEEITYTVTEENVPASYTCETTTVNDGGKITNTHEPEVIDIPVEKIWKGPAGNAVIVTLYADGEATTNTVTLNANNSWKGTFEDLPKKAAGKDIKYTVVEAGVSGVDASKYTTTITGDAENGFVITNTNTETVDIEVTKAWADNSDQDGIRPDELELTLNSAPEGTTAPDPVITNNGDSWTYKWTGLPKYTEDGTEIQYTVSEDEVPSGYTKSPTDPVSTGGTITNTHTPEVTEATVKKVWEDANDQDRKRPASLTVTLSNGTEVTLNADNNWTQTVSGLPKFADGEEIEYTWTEGTLPDGYELTGTSKDGTVTTLTNSYTPEVTEATVKKVWDDAENQDGKRPETLTVTLSDGQSVTLSEENGWTATITGLPKYSAGDEIVYTWAEGTLPEGYTLSKTEKDGTVTTLTNSYTPEVTEATVKKVWDDAENQDGIRPASLEVTLSDGQKVTLSETNSWTATVTGLPKYADGEEIEYTWTEGTLPDGYELTGTSKDGTVTTLTNSHTPEETEATVKKVWDDAENQDGFRPDSLEVTLSDGQTVTLSEENGWTATITGLPKYSAGQLIEYTWTEASIDEYTLTGAAKDGTVTTLTNRHVPEQVEIEVEKVWDDAENQDGKRPDSVSVNLLSNGTIVDTVELNEQNEWKYTWTKLDKYAGGEEIEYTVEEVKTDVITGQDGPGTYADDVSGDIAEGYIVTNTHTPETVNVSVKKVWDDDNNRDGKQPESLTVTLSNGDTVTLGASNNWEATIEGLPKYKDGVEIEYAWTEADIDGYELTGTAAEGYVTTLTNSHTPERTTVKVTKVWDDADDKDGIRPTEITVTLLADGTEAGTAVLSESNEWTYTWTDLYKYAEGKEIAYTVSEEQVKGYDEPVITGTAAEGFTIKNHHIAKPDAVMSDPPVQKVVQGNPPTAATFTFQMKAVTEGAPMPDGSADGVKTVQITGTGSEEFGEMWFEEAGEWVYEITELNGGVENYTYDTSKYTLTITVEEVPDGTQVKLVKTETITGGNGSGSAVFTNVYKPPVPKTGDATPQAGMLALGAALVAGIAAYGARRRED